MLISLIRSGFHGPLAGVCCFRDMGHLTCGGKGAVRFNRLRSCVVTLQQIESSRKKQGFRGVEAAIFGGGSVASRAFFRTGMGLATRPFSAGFGGSG